MPMCGRQGVAAGSLGQTTCRRNDCVIMEHFWVKHLWVYLHILGTSDLQPWNRLLSRPLC